MHAISSGSPCLGEASLSGRPFHLESVTEHLQAMTHTAAGQASRHHAGSCCTLP